jgi:hypothetical protein
MYPISFRLTDYNYVCNSPIRATTTPLSSFHYLINISLTKQQIVVAHTIRQTEIPALLDSWVINTPSVKLLCSQKRIACPYIFIET